MRGLTSSGPSKPSGAPGAVQPADGPKRAVGPAGKSLVVILLFLLVTAAGVAADLISKHVVFTSLLSDPDLIQEVRELHDQSDPQPETRQLLTLFRRPAFWRVRFTLSANPGVVFGWSMPAWAVVSATFMTIGLVGLFFATSDRTAWSAHFGLACVLAGALGNLYDRLYSRIEILDLPPILRNVRDFIDCSDLHYPWVFNVADMLLVVGVAALGLHWFFVDRRKHKASLT